MSNRPVQSGSASKKPFDPYHRWLGIQPWAHLPSHYELLGLMQLEDDLEVIENSASRQMRHVRTFQSGQHSAASQRI